MSDLSGYKICEGISGTWYYHLHHHEETPAVALCGAKTMSTEARIESWGHRSEHINERYCKTCEQLARKEAIETPEGRT